MRVARVEAWNRIHVLWGVRLRASFVERRVCHIDIALRRHLHEARVSVEPLRTVADSLSDR